MSTVCGFIWRHFSNNNIIKNHWLITLLACYRIFSFSSLPTLLISGSLMSAQGHFFPISPFSSFLLRLLSKLLKVHEDRVSAMVCTGVAKGLCLGLAGLPFSVFWVPSGSWNKLCCALPSCPYATLPLGPHEMLQVLWHFSESLIKLAPSCCFSL